MVTLFTKYFSVLPLPSGNKFSLFYLIHNGSDTSDCGKSVDSACFSLLHVLKLYYAEPPTMGLEIRTDKSISIDNTFMVSSQFKGLMFY